MSTIDAHVHLYPPEINADPASWAAAHGESRWAKLCVRRRKDGRPVQGFPSVSELLRTMDAAEVERALLLGWYWEQPENCAAQNRFYAGCVRAHPDRLSAFATVQPAASAIAAAEEIRRSFGEGLIGLGELSPHSQGYAIDGENFRTVLSNAKEFGLPVNLHVTDPASGNYPGRVDTPLKDFVRLAEAWPQVTFILAHWGGGLALAKRDEGGIVTPLEKLAERVRLLGNVFYDTAASPLLYDASAWSRGVAGVGGDRILFGSDFPLNLFPRLEPEAEMGGLIAQARSAGLTLNEATAILGGTARRVLPGLM